MNKHITLTPRSPAGQTRSQTGWMVQSDFDGTISKLDVTDSLLQKFGLPGWQALEDAWERGEIGSRECMQGQIALLDMDRDELHAHLDTIELDPYFSRFIAVANARGIPVQVVSDGIDYAIRYVLQRHGLGDLPVIANQLVQTGPRSWQLQSPWARAACPRASGNCKCERLAEQQLAHGKVLYIGDGSSDFCVSAKADYVLAKDKLVEHCVRNGIAHSTFTDFSQALAMLPEGMELAA